MQFKPHYFKFKGKIYKTEADIEDQPCSVYCDLSSLCGSHVIQEGSCARKQVHYIEVKNV